GAGRGCGAAADSASVLYPYDTLQFYTALMATFLQKGQSCHPRNVPLGFQGQVLSTDLDDPDAFFRTFSHHHFIPYGFQGEAQDIEATGNIGDGRGTEYLDFFHGSIISDSNDIRKDTRCGHIRPGPGPFYDQRPIGIALGIEQYDVVAALQMVKIVSLGYFLEAHLGLSIHKLS